MKEEDLMLAIRVLTEHHSNEIIINKVKADGSIGEKPTLHIKNCVGAVVNKLIQHGFSLSMDNGLLSVNRY